MGIFAIQIKGGNAVRLVKARGPISARSYVAEAMIEVRVPEADELYRLAQSGIKLEDATAQPEPPALAPVRAKTA